MERSSHCCYRIRRQCVDQTRQPPVKRKPGYQDVISTD